MIVRLNGGIGNQMFQWAFGRSISFAKNEELFFKKHELGAGEVRTYSLDAFKIDVKFAEPNGYVEYKEKIVNIFDLDVMNQPVNTFFVGCWQTEKYFNESIIREELILRNEVNERTNVVANEIMMTDRSAFVHVRRGGDYQDAGVRSIFGGLELDYYERGIRYLQERISDLKIFIFTDDPDWCKRTPTFLPYRIVDHNGVGDGDRGPSTEHEDIWLMSLCRHAVIPSSSFGWWGAWLGETNQSQRIVVTPKDWYKVSRLSSKDIIPERWVKI